MIVFSRPAFMAAFLFVTLTLCQTGWSVASGSSQQQEPNLIHVADLSGIDTFDSIRQAILSPFDNWNELLPRVERIVRSRHSDPAVRIEALELLAEMLPRASRSEAASSGKAWTEFCGEYSAQLAQLSSTNGTGDTELAFRTVSVLRKIAPILESIDPRHSARIYLDIGRIGRALSVNSAYPAEARSGLAPLLMAEAHGFALLNDGQKAQSSIQLALEWGLVDFEELYDDGVLVQCSTGQEIKNVVASKQKAYAVQVRQAVVQALANFQSFDFQFSLPTLSSIRRDKSHYEDCKLVVVDIWGTWCNPCRASIPHMIRLQKEFGSKGVRIVGIAMEQEPTVEKIQERLREFATENGITYDLLVGNDAVMEQIPGNPVFPTLVFLDERGTVRFSTGGYRDYTQLKTITEELLKRSGPSIRQNTSLQPAR